MNQLPVAGSIDLQNKEGNEKPEDEERAVQAAWPH